MTYGCNVSCIRPGRIMDGSAQIRSLGHMSLVWTHPAGGAPNDSLATQPRHMNWGLLRVLLSGSMVVAALTAGHSENTSAARCCVVAAMAVVGVAPAVFFVCYTSDCASSTHALLLAQPDICTALGRGAFRTRNRVSALCTFSFALLRPEWDGRRCWQKPC